MSNKILMFGDIAIKKNKFYLYKSPFTLRGVDIEKVLVSPKISFGEKNYIYIIGHLHNDNRVKPLHIMPPKTSAYIKGYDEQCKWIYFSIEDGELSEKYNTIWDKVR